MQEIVQSNLLKIMILEAKRLAKEEQEDKGANETGRVNASERLKILTPNQMLKKITNSSCTSKSRL